MGLSNNHAVVNHDPAFGGVAVTPSDTVNIKADNTCTRGVYVGTAGDVKVTMANGDVVTFFGAAAGVEHPWAVLRIWSSVTSASQMVALF